jgi:hypothetical protein
VTARRALLIGIDAYPRIRPLDGCVNDSRLMRSVLVERFGFPEADITQLLDAAATRDAILGAFDALVAATGDGDVVVVHYAGHGSQMRDREGDEASGFDSTLMPWDTGREPDENRDITDDEIHLKLQALAAKTPHITLVVDACHSGTVTRDALGAKTRSVAPDLRPVTALAPSPLPPSRRTRGATGAGGWLPLTDSYVLIAGCRDDEESKEYFPPEGGGPHGALTCFLCHELLKATDRTTYRDVFEATAARVNAYNAVQHPQIEGTADRVVFGVTDLSPAPFVRIAGRDGGVVRLAAGGTLGVTVGSTYTVQPAGTKVPAADTALGEMVVRTVTPFEAEAEITRESTAGGIVAGTRAFETAHAFGDDALAVTCIGPEAQAAFAPALQASARLRPAPPGVAAAIRVHLLAPRSAVSAADPVPQAGALDAERWAVVDATGALVMPLKPRGDESTVVRNLEKIARFARTLAADNPAPGDLRGRVSVEVLTRQPSGEYVAAAPDADSGLPVVNEGQRVRFRITNHHDRPLFVAVVYLGTGCEITVPAHLQLAAGVSDGSLTGPVTFPPNYPFVDLGDALRGVDSVETVKLFVTGVRVDFSGLAQAGVRAFSPEPEPAALSSQGQWTTASRSFLVRRRAAELGASTAAAADAAPVAVGHAVVAAPAIVGTVTAGRTEDGRDDTAAFATGALSAALAAADVSLGHTVTIDGARHAAASRGATAPAPIAVTLRPPPEGCGQMVLASDELGVVSWSFAPAGPSTRSADGRSAGRAFLIPSAVPDGPAGQPASRGVIGIIGRKVVKELVFPIVQPMLGQAGASAVHWLESTRWPYRVRTFTPDDYTASDAAPIDRDGWTRLGAGRALLMVHGTFSRSHLAFAAWPTEDIAALYRQYGGRVFAFDHLFLSEDPAANVRWLVSQMPDDADLTLDIVCHSRGGLVSRVLSEKQGELSLGGRRIRVGKVVLVGVPNAGTPLADPAHVTTLLDAFTNVVNFLPDELGTPVLTMLVEFAKLAAIGALDNLAGLKAMLPGGDFMRWINTAGAGDARYFAVASDVVPTDPGLRHFVRSRALAALLKGGNDLVVPSEGTFAANGAPRFPVADPLLLRGEAAVSHTKYFADAGVRRQVLAWLAQA